MPALISLEELIIENRCMACHGTGLEPDGAVCTTCHGHGTYDLPCHTDDYTAHPKFGELVRLSRLAAGEATALAEAHAAGGMTAALPHSREYTIACMSVYELAREITGCVPEPVLRQADAVALGYSQRKAGVS